MILILILYSTDTCNVVPPYSSTTVEDESFMKDEKSEEDEKKKIFYHIRILYRIYYILRIRTVRCCTHCTILCMILTY